MDALSAASACHPPDFSLSWTTNWLPRKVYVAFYTMGHKNGANLFFSVTLPKINGFIVVFTVRFSDERYVCWYELHPRHLINAAVLPCENQKTENAYEHSFGFQC